MDLLNELIDDEEFLELVNNFHRERLPQTYRERPNHFTKWNDRDFKFRFRLSKEVVQFLIEELSENISSRTDRNHALSPTDMIFLTLRFLATGCFLQVAGDFCGIDKSTASRTVHKVLRALAGLKSQYIKVPDSEEELQVVRNGFYNIARFPKCIGAIDCTHIKITNPGGHNAEIYRNRKSFFSLNVQVVGDATLKIRNIVCRWPDSSHDANIFRNFRIKHDFQNGRFQDTLLVGDSGYPIKSYLITPLSNPVTRAENLFNEAQIRIINPIERLFGLLKWRFPILATGVRLNLHKVEAVIIACAVLHDIAIMMGEEEPAVDNAEIEAAIEVTNNVNNEINARHGNVRELSNTTRHVFITQYFQALLNERNE